MSRFLNKSENKSRGGEKSAKKAKEVCPFSEDSCSENEELRLKVMMTDIQMTMERRVFDEIMGERNGEIDRMGAQLADFNSQIELLHKTAKNAREEIMRLNKSIEINKNKEHKQNQKMHDSIIMNTDSNDSMVYVRQNQLKFKQVLRFLKKKVAGKNKGSL